MWKPFDPNKYSVVCAFNVHPTLEEFIVSSLLANQPYDSHASLMEGKFQGVLERSYQIDKRVLDWEKFLRIMHTFEQDMVLLVKDSGEVFKLTGASNYYHDSFSKSCGKFKEVTEEVAELSEDYTYCWLLGKYYVLELDND